MGALLDELRKFLMVDANKKDLIKLFVNAKNQNLTYRSFKMHLHKSQAFNTKDYDPQLE